MFPATLHQLCMIHFADIMDRRMTKLGMTAYRKIVMNAILGRLEAEDRLQGFGDCRTLEEYAKAELETCDMMTDLHAKGHALASFSKTCKAPQLQPHYSVNNLLEHSVKQGSHRQLFLSFVGAAREAAGLDGAQQTRNFELSYRPF